MTQQPCGCCEGIEKLTPFPIANRPGLDALAYRVGTHATFLETMQARLSDLVLELIGEDGDVDLLRPLRALTTRDADDPALAFLDAWATVADVLTFYQERIANEGYLGTATELRSAMELARLIGYIPRPGVAASVPLAFELEQGHEVEIPTGTRAQSIPGPDEMPQVFETSEPLLARDAWNALKPRMTRPQHITTQNAETLQTLYFEGTATNLNTNDRLLLVFSDYYRVPRLVKKVDVQNDDDRTLVTLQGGVAPQPPAPPPQNYVALWREVAAAFRDSTVYGVDPEGVLATKVIRVLDDVLTTLPPHIELNEPTDVMWQWYDDLRALWKEPEPRHVRLRAWIGDLIEAVRDIMPEDEYPVERSDTLLGKLDGLVGSLVKPASIQPAHSTHLARSNQQIYNERGDLLPRVLTALKPELKDTLYTAWSHARFTPAPALRSVDVLRVKAAPFGHNAPLKPDFITEGPNVGAIREYIEWDLEGTDQPRVLPLDVEYEGIVPGSLVLIERPGAEPVSARVEAAESVSLARYGLAARVTQLTLDRDWLTGDDTQLSHVRGITIYAQNESLELADEDITEDVSATQVEVGGVYPGLNPGRWVIVSGERTDIPDTEGVHDAELVMLASVTQDAQKTESPIYQQFETATHVVPEREIATHQLLPGDSVHTTLVFANPLAYTYKRDTVTIYGNVVMGTHGETREEVLGSGDGTQPKQTFTLNQAPLTFVSAPTPSGIESTLNVRVDDVLWHEAPNLYELEDDDHEYVTDLDQTGKATLTFGDGIRGARLPSGVENVKAEYRVGIGAEGNVDAEQISQLMTRPLGVKGVLNPLAATGGADHEQLDDVRRNAPMAVMALDRLVSIQDYADFARTFAGIGKASARLISNGRYEVIHVTVAGADDIPIDVNSDLYRNLLAALQRYGDPQRVVSVAVREMLMLLVNVRVRVMPDYRWQLVAPEIRAALLDAFSFNRRELGQDVHASDVQTVVQRVRGVDYVDLDILDYVPEYVTPSGLEAIVMSLQERSQEQLGPPEQHLAVELARITGERDAKTNELIIRPAQIAYLSPDVSETLILTELRS